MAALTADTLPKASTVVGANQNMVDSLLDDDGATLTYTGALGIFFNAMPNLTSNGLVTTSGGTGLLSITTAPSGAIVGISDTQTLTNKRITPRVVTVNAPGAAPTTNTDNCDIAQFTGLAAAITSMTSNLSGTPVDGDTITFQFTDNATARAITWGASFEASGIPLPVTTIVSQLLAIGFQYNGVTSKWRCIGTSYGSVMFGTQTIRQSGGTPGTDEIQISHDGTRGTIGCFDGELRFGSGSYTTTNSTFRVTNSGYTATQVFMGPTVTVILSGAAFAWSGSATDVEAVAADVGFMRGAANTVKFTTGTSGSGWYTYAGQSRVTTADITNVTTTLAAVTGLTATVIAGRKYIGGKVRLYVQEATAADGLKLDMNGGDATWTTFRATYVVYDTLAVVPLASGQVSAIGTAFTVAILTGAAWVDIEFSGVCNAGGTLIPRQAKNSDAAGAALTTRIDSNMVLQECA